jgi:hypothetical protein
MARRSKSRGNSPNTVLVIFLVLFILSNIGFGVWVYNLFQERDTFDVKVADRDKQIKDLQATVDFWKLYTADLRAAVGDPEFFAKSDNLDGPNGLREKRKLALVGSGGTKMYTNEDAYGEYVATTRYLENNLGAFGGTAYPRKFSELADPLAKQVAALAPERTKWKQEYDLQVAKVAELEKKFFTERQKIIESIKVNQDTQLADLQKAQEVTKQVFEKHKELIAKYEELQETNRVENGKLVQKIDSLEKLIAAKEKEAKSPNRALVEPHALVLDISKGKPLWDLPRGKVTKFDTVAQKVYINKGSQDGVKTGLTFNVFAPSFAGRAEGKLKATIEVTAVTGEHSAQCKVNTYFIDDAKEPEAAFEKTTPSALRDSLIVEGDLLFNMFWGSHVVLAGVLDFTGYGANSPAAQMQNLLEFMRYLERIGVVIDGYVDLRDGKFVGQVTADTNYLVRGSNAVSLGVSDSDARIKGINDTIKSLTSQSVDKGLFIVSPANFAAVTGYRRPGSADNVQALEFRPGRPAAGSGILGDTEKSLMPDKK